MSIIRCEDLSEDEIDSIRASKPVLLVGSAVSLFWPSDLPNGETVTKKLVAWLAGVTEQPASKDSPDKWPRWLVADAGELPFEAVLEAYPDQDSLPGIICSLFGKSDVEPNGLHNAIGDGLSQGLFSGLITTNYDLAFDNYLAKHKAGIPLLLRKEESCAWMDGESRRPAYWKIHGTARIEDKDTIVANLARERRMDDWKQKLLKRLVEGRTIVFLGYSGRDFDICPELACLGSVFDAVWLAQKPKRGDQLKLNANQSRILEKSGGRAVLGDLFGFLGKLCERSIERVDRMSAPVSGRDYFDESLLVEWRVRLLERLACPKVGLPLMRSLPAPQSIEGRLRESKMLHHEGSGLKAVRLADSIIKDAREDHDKLDCLLEASTGWWVCGSGRKSRARLRSAKKLASSTAPTLAQQGKMAEAELLQWVMRDFVLGWVPILRGWFQDRGREYYRAASSAFERSDLDGLYSVHHDAERLGVEEKDGFASAAELGFRALGLRILQSQKERDRIMDLQIRLSLTDLRSCYAWWRRAERYGWKPESWKWAWILIWYGRMWRHSELWRDWFNNFWKTEYPWPRRFLFFFGYLGRGLVAVIRNHTAPPKMELPGFDRAGGR
jgi:hypothetical protein